MTPEVHASHNIFIHEQSVTDMYKELHGALVKCEIKTLHFPTHTCSNCDCFTQTVLFHTENMTPKVHESHNFMDMQTVKDVYTKLHGALVKCEIKTLHFPTHTCSNRNCFTQTVRFYTENMTRKIHDSHNFMNKPSKTCAQSCMGHWSSARSKLYILQHTQAATCGFTQNFNTLKKDCRYSYPSLY